MAANKSIENLSARIEAYQRDLVALRERKAKMEALARAREGKQERAADTRRKILAGAVILNAVKLGKVSPLFLDQLLDEALNKPADRELFKLPPKAQIVEPDS